jgi:hypothetical protein
MKNIFLFMFSVLFSGLVLIGCNTENSTDNPISTDSQIKEGSYLNDGEYLSKFGEELRRELALVKSATARYQNIDNAIEDGYVDIDLYIPNMGWHFLKGDLVDETFEVEKPELLVYADNPIGGYRLVAVEYAVPVALSSNAPEGFTGEEDAWVINQAFGLWTLHAWVWYNNPDGMFNPTNPRVN